jgi:hypothetical protein
VPLLPHRIGVARADPAVVRRVRAEEEAWSGRASGRRRLMRELHSGVAISRRRRELEQQASTPIGKTLRVRTPARFRGFPLSRGAKHEAG